MTVAPPTPMRLLFVGNFLSGSGLAPQVCEMLADRMSGLGFEIYRTSSARLRALRLAGMVATAWRLRRRIDAAHIDVFSGASFLWAEAVAAVLRAGRKPYVLSLHGGNLPAFSRRWPNRVRRLLSSAATVTSPSRYLAAGVASYCARIVHVPNGIDVAAFQPVPHPMVAPELIWMRSFHPIYEPEVAIHTVRRLAADFPGVRLRMFGPDKGGAEATARSAARTLGVESHVEFGGRIPKADVPRRLGEGDIFLNTSRIDNAPVSVVEAMAAGLCIVSTNVGGIPYLLEHERDALLVPPGDAAAMAEAVKRLLTDPDLSERLSANARRKAERFDWSVVAPQWQTIFHTLTACRE